MKMCVHDVGNDSCSKVSILGYFVWVFKSVTDKLVFGDCWSSNGTLIM